MFPERLKSLRKERGLTQKEVAEQFKFSQPAYQQWESGKKKPSSETLEKFANFFNVSTDYLLGNSEYKTRERVDNSIDFVLESDSLTYEGQALSPNQIKDIKSLLSDYLSKSSQ